MADVRYDNYSDNKLLRGQLTLSMFTAVRLHPLMIRLKTLDLLKISLTHVTQAFTKPNFPLISAFSQKHFYKARLTYLRAKMRIGQDLFVSLNDVV